MNIQELLSKLDAMVCVETDHYHEIVQAFACDLMSDVLALVQDESEKTLLITGLLNPQVIRTAEMLDLKNILFVRGKRPNEEMVALGKDTQTNMYATDKSMYEVCGILNAMQLPGAKLKRLE